MSTLTTTNGGFGGFTAPGAPRFRNAASAALKFFAIPAHAVVKPAGLEKMNDHLLRDIGVERQALPVNEELELRRTRMMIGADL